MLKQPQLTEILIALNRLGHAVFDTPAGDNLNIVGIRSEARATNQFDDLVCLFYRLRTRWVYFAFPATTDPGTYWLLNPMNIEGTAVLKPGQYRGVYSIGQHKGKPALVQSKPVTVYRDPDRDAEAEVTPTEETGFFGINLHRAGALAPSHQVDRWSAGCQVIQDPLHMDFILAIAARAADRYGNVFTYTLIDSSDLD